MIYDTSEGPVTVSRASTYPSQDPVYVASYAYEPRDLVIKGFGLSQADAVSVCLNRLEDLRLHDCLDKAPQWGVESAQD